MTFYAGDTVKKNGKNKIWTVDSTTEDENGDEEVLITREDKSNWCSPQEITLYMGGEQRELNEKIHKLTERLAEEEMRRKEEADAVTAIAIDSGMIPIAWLRTLLMGAPTAYTAREDKGDLSFSDPNASGMMRDTVTKAQLDLRLDRSRATLALMEALRK